MKKTIAASFLFMFMLAIASPVVGMDNVQEPQKTEKKCSKKCDKDKKDCCAKKECSKSKKECCKHKKAESEKK